MQQLIQNLMLWMEQFAVQYGYLGAFVISLIGSISVVFPIPYTLAIYILAYQAPFLEPSLIAIAGGLGAALGEFSGYILGYYGRSIIDEKRKKQMKYMLKIFNRYGSATIFVFALSPLPDDLLFIPLGIMKYNFLKAFIPALAGKTLMTFILAYGGRISNDLIKNIFVGSGAWTVVISAVLLLVIVYATMRIDWEKVFCKYFAEED